jgi:uncharacterized membrane-anchored protein
LIGKAKLIHRSYFKISRRSQKVDNKTNKFEAVLGIVVIASLVTGVAGLLAAVFAFFSADWVGVGVCLGAAALAFGLVANAILRQ